MESTITMAKKISIIISIVSVISFLSCNNSNEKNVINKSSEENAVSKNIEQVLKSSAIFENSELKIKRYEEVYIKLDELPNYKTTLSDISYFSVLLQKASQFKQGIEIENDSIDNFTEENIDNYIEFMTDRINRQKHLLSEMERKCTDKMYKVICEEHIKFEGNKTGLRTHVHIYMNDKFEIVDFIH